MNKFFEKRRRIVHRLKQATGRAERTRDEALEIRLARFREQQDDVRTLQRQVNEMLLAMEATQEKIGSFSKHMVHMQAKYSPESSSSADDDDAVESELKGALAAFGSAQTGYRQMVLNVVRMHNTRHVLMPLKDILDAGVEVETQMGRRKGVETDAALYARRCDNAKVGIEKLIAKHEKHGSRATEKQKLSFNQKHRKLLAEQSSSMEKQAAATAELDEVTAFVAAQVDEIDAVHSESLRRFLAAFVASQVHASEHLAELYRPLAHRVPQCAMNLAALAGRTGSESVKRGLLRPAPEDIGRDAANAAEKESAADANADAEVQSAFAAQVAALKSESAVSHAAYSVEVRAARDAADAADRLSPLLLFDAVDASEESRFTTLHGAMELDGLAAELRAAATAAKSEAWIPIGGSSAIARILKPGASSSDSTAPGPRNVATLTPRPPAPAAPVRRTVSHRRAPPPPASLGARGKGAGPPPLPPHGTARGMGAGAPPRRGAGAAQASAAEDDDSSSSSSPTRRSSVHAAREMLSAATGAVASPSAPPARVPRHERNRRGSVVAARALLDEILSSPEGKAAVDDFTPPPADDFTPPPPFEEL